ncbi:hypothetical protein ACJJTC_003170 [Scirpophaga incertulas]
MDDENINVEFPRKLVKRLIEQYRQLPCLWNRSHPSYRDKIKRHKAISKLTELVQEHDPTATRVHVLRKLESLRACMRREHKKVVQSKTKSSTPDQIYTPLLWYYDLFSFAFTNEDGGSCSDAAAELPSSSEHAVSAETSSEEEAESILGSDNIEYEAQGYPVLEYTAVIEGNENSSKSYQFDEDQSKATKRSCSHVDDEYDAIGINVAAKLRTLPPNMRILAEKLINDVLFQAQVNGLSSTTAIVTVDPFKIDRKYTRNK